MKSKIFHFLKHPNRWVLVCLVLVLCVGVTFAADTTTGIGAINQVANDITKYVPAVQTLLYAIAGVVALGGAVSVYIKMNNEEQDVKKSIMMIIGACIFLVAAAQALPMFFGING